MTEIHEGIVDKRIQQTIDFSKGSDTRLKLACIVASPIVGTYSHGTQQIAKATKRSVSTVENWAHAHWLYVALRREYGLKKMSRKLWRELPASHWWLAYDIYTRGFDAMYYLTYAFMYHASGRAMMQEFDADLRAGNAPLQFRRAVVAFRGLADELLKRKDLTDEQISVLMKVQEVFK